MTQTTNTDQFSFPAMRYLQRNDGVRLAYTEAGNGTPMVLIHQWLGDHAVFAPQFNYFKQTHRVIAVDLRGHGESDKPEQDYTMAAFADDIVWLCDQLGVVQPLIVTHSMGGNIALEITARYPDLATALVLIETLIFPVPLVTEHILPPLNEGLKTSNYREAIRQSVAGLFLPQDDQALKARLIEQAATAPQYVARTAFLGFSYDFDSAAYAAACKVPVAYIAASNPVAQLTPFRELCPQLVTSQVMQSGHYAPLIAPDQVNIMIERFFNITVPASIFSS